MNNSGLDEFAFDITKKAIVPTAIITALAYFLGWSVSAAYYLSFGLSPNFLQKSLPEMMTTAWVELLIGAIIIALAIALYRLIVILFPNENETSNNRLLLFFYLAFFLSLVLGVLSFYIFITTRLRLRYLVIMGLFIFSIWAASVSGFQLLSSPPEKMRTLGYRIYRILFPSFFVYFVDSTHKCNFDGRKG